MVLIHFFLFFFNDTATTEIYTLSLHDALPIYVPAPAVQPAKKAVVKPPPPKPAAPTTLTLAAGTRVPLAASESISTRHAHAGDAFTATVSQDVKDAAGHVVIPAGSTVSGTITAAVPAPNPNSAGHIDLAVTSVSVRGASYAIDASVAGKENGEEGGGGAGAHAPEGGAGGAPRAHPRQPPRA